MMLGRFFRLILAFLIGLAAGLGLIALFANQLGMQPPVLYASEIGALGPIGLVFLQKMQPGTVESRLQIRPSLASRTSWDGRTLWIWPNLPVKPGRELTIHLADGALAEGGGKINQAASLTVRVREPQVVFLSPATDGSEIWSKAIDGGVARKVTETGSMVYDFAPSYNGQWLAFSVKILGKGKDLWIIKREGTESRKLVECSPDSCVQPAWSPDGKWIAYSRRGTSAAPGDKFSTQPRIWTVEVSDGKTSALYQDPSIGGVNPSWSPDGRRLAFFDPTAKVIHVLDRPTGKEWLLDSKMGSIGAWSPSGDRLWFGDLVSSETLPFGTAFVADTIKGIVQPLFTRIADPEDFGVPQPTPDGEWVAIGVRFQGGSHSIQLEWMHPDGTERKSITDDHTYTHGAYSWDPTGALLVYQRVVIGSSQARPEIMVWDRISESAKLLYQNAALPAWLP